MGMDEGKVPLTDVVKASVVDSGVLTNLKQVAHEGAALSNKGDQPALNQQALAAIEDIQQLLSNSTDDRITSKLAGLMAKLQNALEQGTLSRAAITAALSEAGSAMSSTGSVTTALTQQQVKEKLWKKVEVDNKEIDDDFGKMRKAGVHFNDGLWNRHKELLEYMQKHPQDLKKQKELDAVDDALLMQAEPQMASHPDAKSSFDDAKAKSKDRHEAVDTVLAKIEQKHSDLSKTSDADWNSTEKSLTPQPSAQDISINDITSQIIGQKIKSTGKSQDF